jgi:5-methylcytosine-specific restriction endonuclease McrA
VLSDGSTGKRCATCRTVYPATTEHFVAKKKLSLGLDTTCRTCRNAACRKSYHKCIVQRRRDMKAYQETHREEARQRTRAWHKAHPGAVVRWNHSHPEERKRANLRWRARHPEHYRLIELCKRARRRHAPGHFRPDDLDHLYVAQQGRCRYCGTDLGDTYEVDHKLPISRGGSHWPENLCLSCPRCNHRKFTKSETEFLAILALEAA